MADLWMDVDTALGEVPVNIMPLLDSTDFKTIEDAVVFNQAGLALFWNFVTTAGVQTCTAVTPTSAGDYDWTDQGTSGMYAIEIPASGGASINNDAEGFGWFTGVATGVLPWRGPVIGFRAAALNNSLIDAGTTGLLAPTTAARTLDVSAAGNAGIDWSNVEAPTTAQGLTGTTLGLIDGAITAAKIAADAITAAKIQDAALTAAKFASGAFDAVWTVTTRELTAFSASFKTGYALSAAGVQAVWDALTSALTTVGSIGKLLVDNVNATISSRSSHSAADVWAAGTRTLTSFGTLVADVATAVWSAVTRTLTAATNITSTGGTTVPQTGDSFARLGVPAGASTAADIATVASNVVSIKAKTDLLPEGIKTNQGLNNFSFFMADSTDHVTGVTGLTVTAERSIDGGAFAACTNSPTEIGSGFYKINLSAADLNGTTIVLKFTSVGADGTAISLKTAA